MHSFSTSPSPHYCVKCRCLKLLHNAEKNVICSKFLTTQLAHSKVKCGLFRRIISSTVRFKIARIYARSVPQAHGHKRLDDDATENVKPYLQHHIFCGIVTFAVSRKHVTVDRQIDKVIYIAQSIIQKSHQALYRVVLLSSIFRLEYLILQTY